MKSKSLVESVEEYHRYQMRLLQKAMKYAIENDLNKQFPEFKGELVVDYNPEE